MTSTLFRLVLAGMMAALTACAEVKPPPPPPVLDLQVSGGRNQNLDPGGTPVSMRLRVYQLASTAQFERADAFALIERDKAVLGQELIAVEEFPITPGETKPVVYPLKPGVQFIGVIALFREIDRAAWRASQPAAANGLTKLQLRTEALKISLTPSP